jgi:hypothetical protein
VPYLISVWNTDTSRIRAVLPQDHLKEGCFAVPVSADKTDAFTRVEGKTRLLKNDLTAIAFIQVVYLYHFNDSLFFWNKFLINYPQQCCEASKYFPALEGRG